MGNLQQMCCPVQDERTKIDQAEYEQKYLKPPYLKENEDYTTLSVYIKGRDKKGIPCQIPEGAVFKKMYKNLTKTRCAGFTTVNIINSEGSLAFKKND